ncbi:MAG: ATP-binding protein [Anaerolineae bacterium]|nr:ATP-binding protein [Anaerolineae bacterium]
MSVQDPHIQLMIQVVVKTSQSDNTDEILVHLAQTLTERLNLRACWVGLVDSAQNILVERASVGGKSAAELPRISLEASASDPAIQVIRTNRVLAISPDNPDGASLAYVPIPGQTGALGVIKLVSDASRPLTEDDLLIVEACARQVAVRIESTWLLEGLRRRLRRWAGAVAACKALHRSLSLPQVFEAIAQGIVEALGFRMAAINVREGAVSRVAAVVGPPEAVQKLSGLRVPWEAWAEVMQERYRISRSYLIRHEYVNWDQVALSPYLYRPDLPERPSGCWHPEDMLLIPIYQDEQVIGLISVDDPEDGLLPDLDTIQMLEVFADQAALALLNAQLFEALEARNRELDAFAYSISHDLKVPLTMVRGYAEALLLLFSERMDAEEQELAKRILNGADRMTALINDLLLLSRASRITDPPEAVNTYEAVQTAIKRLWDGIVGRDVHIEVSPDLPSVCGYSVWVEQIFANLINNAIKYIGRHNPNPRIVIDGRREGEMVHLWVQDNGLGFSAEQLAHLFEMFSRFHPGEGEGTGLGLSIVKRSVESMKGRIWAESPGPGLGTTFHILLPAA